MRANQFKKSIFLVYTADGEKRKGHGSSFAPSNESIPVSDEIRRLFFSPSYTSPAQEDVDILVQRFNRAAEELEKSMRTRRQRSANPLEPIRAKLACANPPLVLVENFVQPSRLDDLTKFIENEFDARKSASPQTATDGTLLSPAEVQKLGQRTSQTAAFYRDDPYVREVASRALLLLGVDANDFYLENLQVVRYVKEQKFDLHHDAGTLDGDGTIDNPYKVELVDSQDEPLRSFTLFLYLNTIPVENGGATLFPEAKPQPLSVQPVAGSAALWANINADGSEATLNTIHRATPLRNKFSKKDGMNIWFTFRRFDPEQASSKKKKKKPSM